MYIEMLIIAVVVFYIFIVNKKINTSGMFGSNSKLTNILKEKDYDFLLIAKYGDRVYDPNEVFMKRVRNGVLVTVILVFLFLSQLSYLTVIIALVIGYLVFKSQYLSLRRWYKQHLNYIDSLLPYYLKTLEVLIHHYTVPVALAKSVDDAPEVFKPGLKRMLARIESGDSSIDPYMDFAKEYPVRNLQAKAREMKYQARLGTMERKTLIMMVVTGAGSLLLLLISIFILVSTV